MLYSHRYMLRGKKSKNVLLDAWKVLFLYSPDTCPDTQKSIDDKHWIVLQDTPTARVLCCIRVLESWHARDILPQDPELHHDRSTWGDSTDIADMNGDGDLYLHLVKERHWFLHNLILLGDDTGAILPPSPLSASPDRSYSGLLVESDRDNDLDIVVSNDAPDTN